MVIVYLAFGLLMFVASRTLIYFGCRFVANRNSNFLTNFDPIKKKQDRIILPFKFLECLWFHYFGSVNPAVVAEWSKTLISQIQIEKTAAEIQGLNTTQDTKGLRKSRNGSNCFEQ